MANYTVSAQAFVASLNRGMTQEEQAILNGFVAYLNGQATTKGPSRPKQGTITGKVWDICDTLSGQGEVTRKAVIQAGEAAGINYHTVTTQYQAWLSARKAAAAAEAAKPLTVKDLIAL